jgi:membrane protease YdiL (CAAX protease family)
MRINPSVAAAVGMWIAYTAVFYGLAAMTGIPYNEWFANGSNALRTAIIPLAAGSVLLIAFAAYSGWDWLWHDPVRLNTTWVMRSALALWFVFVAVRIVGITWSKVPTDLLVAMVVASVGVGFAEEAMFRGIFLRGMRAGGRSEVTAAVWTAVCFGLFHLPNLFLGTGLIGSIQLVLAALSGMVLYVFRRQWGVIWPAMIAHGVWDFSAFVSQAYSATWLTIASLAMQVIFAVVGIAVFVSVIRQSRGKVEIPATQAL